jgi:hypothetical protein
MKYAAFFLVCLFGVALAQEDKPPEGEKPPEKPAEEGEAEAEDEAPDSKPPTVIAPVDPQKLISDLTLANAVKDVTGIDNAAKQALAWAKGAKPEDAATIETLAKELGDSIKVVKGNWGTLKVIVEALGELRSKEGAKSLKKLAFKKEAKDQQEEEVQALAIVNLGKLADPKEISAFEEISKSESKIIAKAAYAAFGSYGTAKGRIRKQCVEVLMKRLDMEYPSSGGQGGKSVSAEKQERWSDVSPAMVASMKALCREQTINDIENWREWWKDNKKNPKAEAWKDDDDKES